MDNFFDAIKRFVLEYQDREDRYDCLFAWPPINDRVGPKTVIRYSEAEEIAIALEEKEINERHDRERIEELEDYNRLLRKENQELRDCKVEMDQNYLAAISAMKGYSGEVKDE